MSEKRHRYINPYLGGFLLGLVMLAAYLTGGHGLGSSGAIKNIVITVTGDLLPTLQETNAFFRASSENLMNTWIVVMFFGLIAGGFISGAVSRRFKLTVEKGPRISSTMRLIFALTGGVLFGIGSQLGKGCTSGAALSGMAVLSTSGIITMMAIFGTGYAIAALFRRLWI